MGFIKFYESAFNDFSFFAVFLVPELYRKLRETRGINFHQVSSIYVLMVPSYDQKTEFFQKIKKYKSMPVSF